MKNIIVTGGAGYIGSHCVISLIENGFNPIILDNFSNSNPNIIKKLENITKKKIIFFKVDLRNKKKLKLIFKKYDFQAVIHCAGFKAVKESIERPIDYFDNNISSTLSLLECMQDKKIFKIIFSSSATVYDQDQSSPLKETSKVGKTINPYGTSKYITERILMDISKFDSRWSIVILRYFNPIGNHFSNLIADSPKGTPANLFPNIISVAKKKSPYLKVYGKNYNTKDGTCIRDYIHVLDLAKGHIYALKKNMPKKGMEIFNLGSGKGSTVLELVRTFEMQTGIKIPIKYIKRRKGDAPISFCNPNKAFKKLSWKINYNFNQSFMQLKVKNLKFY